MAQKCYDSTKPMPIDEDEELERIGAMLQRDNLIRSLGVVEHVYCLLHNSPKCERAFKVGYVVVAATLLVLCISVHCRVSEILTRTLQDCCCVGYYRIDIE